jgi:Tfp pilus assembly protein PilV
VRLRCKHPRSRRRGRGRGFTLIEAALTTIIVGVGTVGMMQLLATGTMANATSNEMTIGLTLANNVREMLDSSTITFADPNNNTHWGLEAGETAFTANDLDDFDGYTFTPAVDSRRLALSYLTGWTQGIKVETVNPNNITQIIPHGTQPPNQRPMSRITVTVNHNGNFVCQTSWLVSYIGL